MISHLRCKCENSKTVIILERNIEENFCNGSSTSQNKSDTFFMYELGKMKKDYI